MLMTLIVSILWFAVLATSPAFGQKVVNLRTLLHALESNPQLDMARSAVDLAASRIAMRSSLMDPMFVLGVQNLPTSFSFADDPMTAKVIGLGQKIPFPGKLSSQKIAGELDVKVAESQVYVKQNDLRYEVMNAYLSYLEANRSQTRVTESLKRLAELSSFALIRIRGGQNSVRDLTRIEIEQVKMRAMLLSDETMKLMALRSIKALTNIDTDSLEELDLTDLNMSTTGLSTKDVISNPSLQLVKSRSTQIDAEQEIARLKKYPDFEIMVMYMQRDALMSADPMTGSTTQRDMLGAQLTLNLPLNFGGQLDAAQEEINAMRRMNESEARMIEREITTMIEGELVRFKGGQDRFRILSNALDSAWSIQADLIALGVTASASELTKVVLNELERNALLKERDLAEFDMIRAQITLQYLVGTPLN